MTRGFQLVVAEGDLDAVVARRLLEHLGIAGPVPISLGGGSNFWKKAPKYNQAARNGQLILGVVDLESSACAPELITQKLPQGVEKKFVLRVAHRMIESWLLADRSAFADFLGVSISRIGTTPESLDHPKHEIARLARRSRKRTIRETLVPEIGLTGPVGKEYAPMMKTFVEKHWDPSKARLNSPSLDRAMKAIQNVVNL